MEGAFGTTGTHCDGIYFAETPIPGAARKRRVSVEISRQNANLGEVKRRLAREARTAGANAIANFRYGQRAHKWWTHILEFKWDSESWYGEGDAVLVNE